MEQSKNTSATNFAPIFENLNIAAVGLDDDGYIIGLNSTALSHLPSAADAIPLSHAQTIFPQIESLLENARNQDVFKTRTWIRTDVGTRENIELTISFCHPGVQLNNLQLAIILTFDIIAHQGNKNNQQLDTLSRYSREIAHDLNNILNIISGHLEILELETKANNRLEKRVNAISRGVERGRILSARLSHLAYYDKKDVSLCNINKVVKDSLNILQSLLANEVKIKLELCACEPHVCMDISHFVDVLFNLLMNASDAMNGKGEIQVKINTGLARAFNLEQAEPDDAFVCVSFADNGCGIAEHIKDKIFNPFFTTKLNDRGTGIGLNLVQTYMTIHQGFVKLESEINKGSCFSLYFPMIEEINLSSLDKDPSMEIEQKLEGKRVLVVDDEAPILLLLKEFLGIYGLNVQTAHSGSEGLTLATENDFDLILSDLVMPGEIDGAEFASLLLQQKPSSSIIFMSGYTDNRLQEKNELNHIPVITKPFRKKELLSQMELALC